MFSRTYMEVWIMTAMVTSVQERLGQWRRFVAGEAGPGFMFYVNVPNANAPAAPLAWPDRVGERVEWAWRGYEAMCERARLIDDDRVPYLSNMTGTEIFAEAFGCPVHRPDDNNPFALPLIRTAREVDKVQVPELSNSTLAYLFDIADELYRRGGPEAVMKPVDIQSPMDIVALIWDKADLFMAMLDAPDAVKGLAGKVRELLTAFFDEWFKRYGTTFVAHYPDYVMHGGLTLSVDEVGAVSSAMFDEFFRDELVALSEHFGGLGIHCCADARHQWANFRALPGLKVMNHNHPVVRDVNEYIPDAFRAYGDGVVQMHIGWQPAGPPETWPAKYPAGTRVIFEVAADSLEEAAAVAGRLRDVRGW
jgi:hypothetical protein